MSLIMNTNEMHRQILFIKLFLFMN